MSATVRSGDRAGATDRPGAEGQTPHPLGVMYPSPVLMPQGCRLSTSQRGAPLYIVFTDPQLPKYGTGLRSDGAVIARQFIPGQGPIDRGY